MEKSYKIRVNLLKLPGAFMTKDANGRYIVGIYVDTSNAYYLPQKAKTPSAYVTMNAWAVKDGQSKKGETHLLKADGGRDAGDLPICGQATEIERKGNQTGPGGANPFVGITPPPPMQGFTPPTGWGI